MFSSPLEGKDALWSPSDAQVASLAVLDNTINAGGRKEKPSVAFAAAASAINFRVSGILVQSVYYYC
jgi:hypothetical protein